MRFLNLRRLVTCQVLMCVPILVPSLAVADGGALRLSEQKGNYQIAVFTAPTPLRAGPVDVSVLVQNAATREPLSDVRVLVKAASRERPDIVIRRTATNEAATNKLFQAALFDLNEPGWWQVEVSLDGPLGKTMVNVEIEAAKPLPKALDMWPWLTWPVLPILLFGAHQILVRRTVPCSRRLEDVPPAAAI